MSATTVASRDQQVPSSPIESTSYAPAAVGGMTPTRGRVVVVGQGYVGLPIAMRAAEVGYSVVGIDTDEGKVERLRAGESYIEDIPGERLADALARGRYTPTTDYADAAAFDVAVITVPTPLRDAVPDHRYIEAAGRALAPHVRRDSMVVLESTSSPGTTEDLLIPILEAGSGLEAGPDFSVGYSPERIDPGNPTWTFQNTPKLVAGIDVSSTRRLVCFYRTLVDEVVTLSSTRSAELAKLLENTFRHVNIALINEMVICARELGIDLWEVIDAAATKPFGFMRFLPGPGVGGHCLPVDPTYLSWEIKRRTGHTFRFIELANDINAQMPSYIVSRIGEALNEKHLSIAGSEVLVLGLAYKPNSGDLRESPAVHVVQKLLDHGARVEAVDMYVDPQECSLQVPLVKFSTAAVGAADAVVVLTDHDDIDYKAVSRYAKLVIDTRRCVVGPNVTHL